MRPLLPLMLTLALVSLCTPALAEETRPTFLWSAEIGMTTYRSTILVADGRVYVNSNGERWHSQLDALDGVYVLDASDGSLIQQIVPPGTGEKDCNGLALGDGALFFGTDQNALNKWDLATNALVWSAAVGGDVEAAPALHDFTGDGVLDAVVGAEFDQLYLVDGATGAAEVLLETGVGDYGQTGFVAPVALGDATGDGVPDIFAPSRDNSFYALDGADRTLLWSERRISGLHSAPIIADTDGDGDPEVVFTESYSSVVARTPADGLPIWELGLESPTLGGIEGLFGPLTFDPETRLTFVGTAWWKEGEGVYAIRDGIAQWRYSTPVENITSGAVIGDLDGQPGAEICFGTEAGELVALTLDGEPVWSILLEGPVECTPTLADLDGDGLTEVLVASNDGFVRAFTTPGQWSEAVLPYYRGDAHNTGVMPGVAAMPGPDSPASPRAES